MTLHFTAYIDEAGDEGLGKLKLGVPSGQSRWLVIGAFIVRAEQDRELPRWRNGIMDMFPAKRQRDLHFRKLSHEQKVTAATYLADKAFGMSCVCSNKITLTATTALFNRFTQKGHLYNYLTRYLLERVTTAVHEAAKAAGDTARLRVVFSRRGGTDYQSMQDYMILMRDGREKIKPVRSIVWNVFSPDDITVENHSKWAGLQLADVVTSATAAALEPRVRTH